MFQKNMLKYTESMFQNVLGQSLKKLKKVEKKLKKSWKKVGKKLKKVEKKVEKCFQRVPEYDVTK